ncbi:cytochrome d ubiquinol oxidase subunit II [Rhizobiaceae bacterium n13]|uniref:Cytochrome d ubiquinol oxidase subunit II n=1 Tax=Ferirhizobium litorale TaxID=2927786 RepID=A0AAE3QJK8_9HYPH|nr:cytochrome d ubiquinol oxidase subunit II [Fererhizobium litorale]MDI7862742.1 cytochrome d ubiquinol oxidase subunit II [Fererhizobium litorale]MDI7924394.1 cytochrome d ubiquinol oxidase subunit II [Fererhizobium litorale]
MDTLTELQQMLAFAWWMALCLSILLYVMLDGADLGAGIISLFLPDEQERGAIMSAMAGTWDANETWLVVAGGILFGTFPFVYGSAFSYLMLPLTLVLWSIMTRAVALEFRHLAEPKWRRFSDYAFGLSSLSTTFFGGMAIGAVLHGFPLTDVPGRVPTYVGGSLRFISAFSVWMGLAAVFVVMMAGGLFIRARFEKSEPLRQHVARWTNFAFCTSLACAIITVVWCAVVFDWAVEKWFGAHFWVWALVLLAMIYATIRIRGAIHADRDVAAILWFNLAVAIVGVAMMATMFPWIVPNTWTIYSGASPQVSLVTFTLAMGGFLPVMIMYNWYQIWVFRARISKLVAYHD